MRAVNAETELEEFSYDEDDKKANKKSKMKSLLRRMNKNDRDEDDDAKGLPKKFRSFQALWFHLIMTMIGGYTGVMFTSWIQISVSNVQNNSEIVDDVSIWVRSIALFLGLLYSILKNIRLQWGSDPKEDDEEENDE